MSPSCLVGKVVSFPAAEKYKSGALYSCVGFMDGIVSLPPGPVILTLLTMITSQNMISTFKPFQHPIPCLRTSMGVWKDGGMNGQCTRNMELACN